jgi:alkylation response protein AidB-like acyl-CoA dehydrogenase
MSQPGIAASPDRGTAAANWPPYRLEAEHAAAVERVRPLIEETELEAERDRQLPRRVYEALAAEGLFRVALPKELGGWDVDPVTEVEVYEALSRISTSACWNVTAGCINTSWVGAYVADDAAEEIFGSGETVVAAGQAPPLGTGREVPGGVRVTGRYSFGSGMSHAHWVIGGYVVPSDDPDAAPEPRVFVTAKDNVQVLDNWYAIGIAASNSVDYAVDDLYVPDGWHFSFANPEPRRGGPRFSQPIFAQISGAHCGVALGAGERALDEILNQARTGRQLNSTSSLAERGAFQRDVGHARTALGAARDHAARLLGRLGDARDADAPLDEEFVDELVSVQTYTTGTALEVATMAYRYGGPTALRLTNPLQRVLRDLLVAQQHRVIADVSYDALGQILVQRET